MKDATQHSYQFKSFRLDVAERQLLNNDVLVPLTPKAFDVLALLVENGGHLIEKSELLRQVWGDSFVEEQNVARIIHTLRRALGEGDNGNKFIETVATKGYRFVSEVTRPGQEKSKNTSATTAPLLRDEANIPDALPKRRHTQSGAHAIVDLAEWREAEAHIDKRQEPLTLVARANEVAETQRAIRARRGKLAAMFSVAVLAVGALGYYFYSQPTTNADKRSIAVLPLKPINTSTRDVTYELGIAESLIFKLSSAKDLVVRPLSATQAYADANKDPVAIGSEQKVDYVLASNYQMADGKIRVTSQLINVSDGAVVEVFKSEQAISNVFVVQDAVSANIGQMLLRKLNRQSNGIAAKHNTTNEEAYRLYLQGSALSNKHTRKDAEKAIDYLEQAVKLDPNYALAYAQLAGAHSALSLFSGEKIENRIKQKAAIENALAIDENLAEAYASLGEMKLAYEWDFDGAEKALKKALELDPDSTIAHRIYSVYLSSMGRHDEAIAEAKIAIDLEPASVLNHKNLGQFLYFARRYNEAIPVLERTVEMDPNFRTAYGWLINSYKLNGNETKAFESYVRQRTVVKEDVEIIERRKSIFAKSGFRGVLQDELEYALDDEKNGGDASWLVPRLYAELGDKEKTIVRLQKAFDKNQRGWGWTTLKIDPKFDLIRDDPRYFDLLKRVGLD